MDCCYRRNQCDAKIDVNAIIEKQEYQPLYKTRYLILNTSYKKLVESVYSLKDVNILFDDSLDICDVLYSNVSCDLDVTDTDTRLKKNLF